MWRVAGEKEKLVEGVKEIVQNEGGVGGLIGLLLLSLPFC